MTSETRETGAERMRATQDGDENVSWQVYPNAKPPIDSFVLLSWGYDVPVIGFRVTDRIKYRDADANAWRSTKGPVFWKPLPETPDMTPDEVETR
jgi:hypothetical protein